MRDGHQYLEEHRLKPDSPTRRVIAKCCNSAMFLDFTKGNWLSMFRNRFPTGAPPLEMRVMTKERRVGVELADDVPNYTSHSGKFMFKLTAAWIAMGFRRPEITLGETVYRSEHAATTFSKMIHRLKEDVRSWYELHRRNGDTNVVVWAIYLELLLMLVLLILLPFDTVQVGGRYRLIKPLNFSMSMAIYLATVVVLLDYLRAAMWWKKVIGWGVSICILTGITCITMQAARGTTSHFNNSTPFDSTVSSLMDIVDPLNSVFVLVLLIFALRSRYNVSRSSQLGIVFGTLLFLAGSVIGGVMVAHGQSVVGVAPGGPGLPVVNWSTTGGDFSVAHFLGIHALQSLPIAGWLIGEMEGLPRRAKSTAVIAVSAGYVLIMGIVLLQAMNGVPLVRM